MATPTAANRSLSDRTTSNRSHSTRPYIRLGAALLLLVSLVMLAGCGDSAPEESSRDEFDDGPPQAAEQTPLAIESTTACALDSDCAAGLHCFEGACARECDDEVHCEAGLVCTERGRCIAEQLMSDHGADTSALTDREIVNTPQTVFEVPAGVSEVEFVLEFDAALPDEGLPYRIERTDNPDTADLVERTAGGQDRVSITIPVGIADPELEDARLVNLDLFTPLGNYSLAFRPRRPAAGAYAGEASTSTFGTTGLPLQFEVVTRPDNSSFEEAEQAWLVLPVGPEHLFSPIRADDADVAYVARELEYDDFVDAWVAKFKTSFDLSGRDGIVSAPDDSQVRRSLRFQLEPRTDGTLAGVFSDTWSGLYETRSSNGATRLQELQFTGSLRAERFAPAPSHEDIEVIDYPDADPRPLPAPPLDQCDDDGYVDAPAVEVDEQTFDCEGIDTINDFHAAQPAEQAGCAIAVAADALGGETTAGQIRGFLDETTPNPTGQSFADFMEDCAAGVDGICQPDPQVLCSRQMIAHTYRAQPGSSELLDELVAQFQEVSREAYLGQEIGAFGTDSKLRLEWLESTDYPAVVVNAVQSLNEQLLDDWREKVLEVHLGVLDGQFDAGALALLSRELDEGTAYDIRQQVLGDMTQSWRGATDALTLATTRWHSLLQADADRADKRDYVSARMFDLYLSAGLLRDLNQAGGAGYLSGRLAGGFSQLVGELGKLAKPFDELIYARDAEVVVNTSVDPSSGNDTLLAERQEDALDEIDRAHAAVTDVLAEARAEALDAEQLRNRMANEINDLRDELVAQCGMPAGCTPQDFRDDPDCRVRVKAGQCGFTVDKETNEVVAFSPGQQSVSEAGRVLLEVAEAGQNIGIAKEERRALVQRTELQHTELERFAEVIDGWNQTRLEGVAELEANIAERQQLRNEHVKTLFENLDERAANRREGIEDARESFREWNDIRVGNATKQIGMLVSANAARETASQIRAGADAVESFAEAAADGLPTSVGTSNDVSAPARLAIRMGAAGSVLAMRGSAMVLDSAGAALEVARESHALMQDAKMARLEDQEELGALIADDELATLKEEAQKAEQLNDAELARLEEVIELAQAYREAELAHERDIDEFRQRRLDLRQKLTAVAGLDLRVQQAKLQFDQSVAKYLGVVQRASLQDAKLQDLLSQRDNINQLVGSPEVLFSRANRLEQAELRLERAKNKLMDWLVALEYFAVRPFMDQRMAILLARNTYQLEAIAEDLERLERNCGGQTNEISSALSLRRDLLGLDHAITDPVTGTRMAPQQRFRDLLERGYVPVDKRIRYSTDATIGGLMARDPEILSATFFVDLSDFANLELTCNAKIRSLAVNLIGDLGEARPTVSVLYDGTSKLRSCQPDIDDYVDMFGADTTNFGETTHLRTEGRSMSPVAGLNDFGDQSEQPSYTLAGLPLASQYTLLIDTEAGENDDLDWSQLEDIELELTYTYQDVFPTGQCE